MGKPKKPAVIEAEPEDVPDEQPTILKRFGQIILKAVFRPKRLLLLALVPVFGAIAPLVWRHWPPLDDRPIYRLEAADIHITPAPGPVPTNLLERAIGTKPLEEGLSILDDTLLPRLADAFRREPWVSRVKQIRKSLPARVEIELEYRTPVAMIDVKSGVYPVDLTGVLLPPEDFTPAEIARYPLVTGVRSLPAGPPGQPWGDPAVVGAARIAAAIASEWDNLDLTAIHAPPLLVPDQSLDDLNYELHTRGGSTVVWGRPPWTGHPGELTVDQKLGRLKRYVTDFGPLGTPGPAYEIDIRPWQEITRRPLASVNRHAPYRR